MTNPANYDEWLKTLIDIKQGKYTLPNIQDYYNQYYTMSMGKILEGPRFTHSLKEALAHNNVNHSRDVRVSTRDLSELLMHFERLDRIIRDNQTDIDIHNDPEGIYHNTEDTEKARVFKETQGYKYDPKTNELNRRMSNPNKPDVVRRWIK